MSTFEPFPKNPAISKVFREIGLADELGSGMRNTYKFTKLYSGGVPQFIEGDVFKTVIPLNETATMKSGSKSSDQVGSIAVVERYWEFCKTARTKKKFQSIYRRCIQAGYFLVSQSEITKRDLDPQLDCKFESIRRLMVVYFFGNRKLRTV